MSSDDSTLTTSTGRDSDWQVTSRRSEAGWEVEARWWGAPGEPPTDGPLEVLVRLAPDHTPAQRQKGVTSGVLRRLERHVTAMTDQARVDRDHPSVGPYDRMARDHVARLAATLPAGPHGDDAATYYAGLLAIMEELTERGHPTPIALLASVLEVPKGTVKTRLNTARQRRAAAGSGSS
jgi:hypothetical protein